MDKIEKALDRLTSKEYDHVKLLLQYLVAGTTQGLDIAKLKGHTDIYRLRKGKLRIIFQRDGASICLLKVSRRDDITYNKF